MNRKKYVTTRHYLNLKAWSTAPLRELKINNEMKTKKNAEQEKNGNS